MKHEIAWGESECNIVFQSAIEMMLYKAKCNICFVICLLCVFENKHANKVHYILKPNILSNPLTNLWQNITLTLDKWSSHQQLIRIQQYLIKWYCTAVWMIFHRMKDPVIFDSHMTTLDRSALIEITYKAYNIFSYCILYSQTVWMYPVQRNNVPRLLIASYSHAMLYCTMTAGNIFSTS